MQTNIVQFMSPKAHMSWLLLACLVTLFTLAFGIVFFGINRILLLYF